MSEELDKIPVDRMDVGIDVNDADFHPEFALHSSTKNLTMGIHKGLGPRYGMSPIPGHVHNEDQETNIQGMRRMEADATYPRKKFLGIVPIILQTFDDITVYKQGYIWIYSYLDGSTYRLAMEIGYDYNSGDTSYRHVTDIHTGLPLSYWRRNLLSYEGPGMAHFPQVTSPNTVVTFADDMVKIKDLNYVSFAVANISGKKNPAEWLYGYLETAATANKAGIIQTHQYGVISQLSQGNYDNQKDVRIDVWIDNLNTFVLEKRYIYNAQDLSSLWIVTSQEYHPVDTFGFNTLGNADVVEAGANAVGSLTAGKRCLVHIEGLRHETNYTVVFCAAERPLATIIKTDSRNYDRSIMQLIDPTNFSPHIINGPTINIAGTKYTEDLVTKATCWKSWPNFVTGTATVTHAAAARAAVTDPQITLGAALSGILRANTVYEIAYALYDKDIDFETNVGVPAKIQVGATDYVGLTISRAVIAAGVLADRMMTGYTYSPLGGNATLVGKYAQMNHTVLKFYYRAFGSFEWLPAGEMDLPKWELESDFDTRWICTGDTAGLPGGQPGAFIDNSLLANEKYIDVKNFKGRTFWISRIGVYFSLKNKPFTYPLRNSIAAPTGNFTGATAHTYPGLTEQGSRLIVWGSTEAYIGRFTGQFLQSPVRVSSTEVGYFDVEGSDFQIETWTSHTAFSHRSAVVAQGILFWWGPDGIYKDVSDGEIPRKISLGLEPDIFTYYDPAKTDEIHCTYNDKTKEIIWFYPPRDTTITTTKGLTFNVMSGEFLPIAFDGKIDSAGYLNIEKDNSGTGISGKRTYVAARLTSASTVSRPFFFDERNRAGDIFPTQEFMVKTIAAGDTAIQRKLTLQVGYDATIYAALAVGSKVILHQVKKYATTLTNGDDCIAKITSFPSAGVIQVQLPTGVSFDTTASLSFDKYFPIWFSGTHDIDYILKSSYWAPRGVDYNAIWRYLHLIFKVGLLPSIDPQTLEVAYRVATMAVGSQGSGTITMENNCDGNMQRLHQLEGLDQEGQALQLIISGSHMASEWVLQYLAAHTQPQGWDFVKSFEE